MALVPRAQQNPPEKPRRGWFGARAAQAGEAAPERTAGDASLLQDFDALIARYERPLFNYIYQWIGDYEEAADLTQDTFVSAYKAREQFRGESQVHTWLWRIAANHCKNRAKQRGRQREMEGPSLDAGVSADGADGDGAAVTRDVPDWSYAPEALLEQGELRALIDRAVQSLAPEYKEVLLLRTVEGLAYTEIAEVTGLTMEAVKTRLNRARAMVRQRVEPYYKP